MVEHRHVISRRALLRGLAGAGICTLGAGAFWVDWRVWALGLGLILAGLVWHLVARRLGRAGAHG